MECPDPSPGSADGIGSTWFGTKLEPLTGSYRAGRHLQLLQYRLERKQLGEDVVVEAAGYRRKLARTPGARPDRSRRRIRPW